MTERTISAIEINVQAQRFYEAAGLNIPHSAKPEVVKGLAVVLTNLGFEVTDDEPKAKRIIVANYPDKGHHVDDLGNSWWDETQNDRTNEAYFKSGWDAAIKEAQLLREHSPVADQGFDKALAALRNGGVIETAVTEGEAFLQKAHDLGLRPQQLITSDGVLLSVGMKVGWRLTPGSRLAGTIVGFDPRRGLHDGRTVEVESANGRSWAHPGWLVPVENDEKEN